MTKGPAQRILVGRFGAAHGVRGEVRLQSFTQEPRAIAAYGELTTGDGRRLTLSSVRPVKDTMLVVRVAGVADRTAAEALTHVEIYLDRAALPAPEADEFYVADLIGLEAVEADGTPIGTVVDVPNYGGGDLVEVRPTAGGETLLFPFTREVVPTVDVAGRRVTIVPQSEVEGDAPQSED